MTLLDNNEFYVVKANNTGKYGDYKDIVGYRYLTNEIGTIIQQVRYTEYKNKNNKLEHRKKGSILIPVKLFEQIVKPEILKKIKQHFKPKETTTKDKK